MGLLSKFIFSDMEIHNKPRQEMEYHFLLPNQVNVQRIDSFNEPEEFKYSYRFVCFMDMLGCKDLVWKSETSQDAFEQVKKIASVFEEEQRKYATNHWCSNYIFAC